MWPLMCISAEASFAVSASLGVTGIATWRSAGATPLPWLAAVPTLFAVQQCAEGIVRLYENSGFHQTPVSLTAQYVYLAFAFVWWPTYRPLAVAIAEPVPWRRRWAFAAVVGGFCVSAFDTYYLFTTDLTPSVVGHSIQYGQGAVTVCMTYGTISLLPLFIVSIPKLWMLGALSLITFIIAEIFFPLTFISMWCILAAVSDIVVWYVVKSQGDTSHHRLSHSDENTTGELRMEHIVQEMHTGGTLPV